MEKQDCEVGNFFCDPEVIPYHKNKANISILKVEKITEDKVLFCEWYVSSHTLFVNNFAFDSYKFDVSGHSFTETISIDPTLAQGIIIKEIFDREVKEIKHEDYANV